MKMISSRNLSSLHIILFQTVLVAILGQVSGGNISADFFVGLDSWNVQRREGKKEKQKNLKKCRAQEHEAVCSM
jgi:hypothetical protein